MDSKVVVLLALTLPSLLEVANARSPLQFSGRSPLNKDQRAALLKLVQGPKLRATKDTLGPVAKKENSNLVNSRTTGQDADGQLDSEGCMKKVVMVEEVEFDTEIKCQHVSQESCFESYTTTFKKTKAEDCDESFKKECEIEYFKIPKEEKVEVCTEMLTRDCDVDGPEVCSKEYETVCETIYEEHTVDEQLPQCTTKLVEQCMTDQDTGEQWCDNVPKRDCDIVTQTSVKLTPKTECRKEVAEVCGPETCPIVKGERICKDEIKTVIHEVPQETCNMVPRKVCNIVSKVVPTLEPVKHCIDIPKEMCAKSRINPVRKTRPVVRKWCLNENKFDIKHLDNVVYMLTWEGIPNGQDPLMKASLLDATTGKTMCSKPFQVGLDKLGQLPHELSFGLVGENRDLLSCGHEDGTCLAISIDDGEVKPLANPELTNGPGRFAASFLDTEIGHHWITFGGEFDDSLDLNLHSASLSSDASDVSFLQDTLSDLAEYTDEMTGRGCLLKFPGPDDEPVVFYLASFKDNSFGYLVKHGSSVIHTMGSGRRQSDSILGDQPICGFAVETDTSSPRVGDTYVYFFTKYTFLDGTAPTPSSFSIPTGRALQ